MERIKLSDIPELETAINALGTNDVERAAALGFNDRALRLWRSESLPRSIIRILYLPSLANALATAAAKYDKSVILEKTP